MFPGLCIFPRSAKIKCLYTINERHSPAACFPHVQTVSSNPTQPCSPSLHHFHPFPLKNMMGTVRWTDGSCVDRNISPGGRERNRQHVLGLCCCPVVYAYFSSHQPSDAACVIRVVLSSRLLLIMCWLVYRGCWEDALNPLNKPGPCLAPCLLC